LRNMGIVLEEVSPQVMEKLSETQSPQGIVGIGARKQFLLGDAQTKTGKRLVICDGIKDPGNLGAIIRTADVFASDTIVILPNTTNPYAPKAIRASAGGIFNLSVVFTEKETLLPWLTNTGIRLIVTVPQGGKRIRDIDMLKPFAVVIGEEAAGVATDIIGMADELATIPMGGITGSLNAAAAAAVFLYESFRVRAESGVDTVD
ncbi:MAG: RNA methyltransferase, partial [Nitrospirae bacterium]|nr:RNA methyltransferase [Nitrospirota bacterium]